MKARASFKQNGKLEVSDTDTVTIIDGNPERYWWKGQNNRTRMVGHFPRNILNSQTRLTTQDISKPLRNSFIHTGHMSAKPSEERSWGHPGKIDDIFLRNPLHPPDLLDDLVNEEEPTRDSNSIQTTNSLPSANESLTDIVGSINLIDLSDESLRENGINVCHPNYMDSFFEEAFEEAVEETHQQQQKSFFSQELVKPDVYDPIRNSGLGAITVPYVNYQYNSVMQSTLINDLNSSTHSGGGYMNTSYHNNSSTSTLKSNNPFLTDLDLSGALPMRNSLQSNASSSSLGSSSRSFATISPVEPVGEVIQPPSAFTNNRFQFVNPAKKTSDVDELLNKVIKDVMVDFDNLKSNVYK